MYYLFRFATRILPWVPRRLAYALGDVLGLIIWLIARKARKQATKNMLRVLGTQMQETRAGRRKLRYTVQGMFIHNVRNYLELLTLPSLSSEEILHNSEIKGLEHLHAAQAQGKGVIIFLPHQGPFDYTAQCMGVKGYDITIPVESLEDQRMLNLTLELRGSHGIHHMPVAENTSMRTLVQKLRNNKIVMIVADRAVKGRSVEADFFGAPAKLPIGPIKLAQRTGAALVSAHAYRTPQGLAIGQFLPLSLEMTDEQRADTDYMLRAFIEKIEGVIREHPEQWVAFTPIWPGDR